MRARRLFVATIAAVAIASIVLPAQRAGLTEQQSAALNARLILLLANQVGDLATLKEAIAAARAAA